MSNLGLDPRELLTHCAWILSDEDHESGLAGQLTARGPRDNCYWTLPLGLAFGEATPGSWLLIDNDLKVLEGQGAHGIREPNPATRFHLWVYRSRPDVNAIVLTHPPAASALAAHSGCAIDRGTPLCLPRSMSSMTITCEAGESKAERRDSMFGW